MATTWYMFITLVITIAALYSAVVIDNKKYTIVLGILAFLLFVANPFRMEATSIKQVERGVSRFDDIPEKVIVEKPLSFDERNASERANFDKLYEETKDEVHN